MKIASLLIFLAALAAPAPAADDALASLAWMAGDWMGVDGGVEMEERWTEPRGGMMLGIHRDVKAGKAVDFEFFRVAVTPEGIVYFASPRGRPAVPFKAIESKNKRVVFENKEHDFPKRIIYWASDDGSLRARIEGDPGDKEKAMEWTWKRGRF
jgi:hypothetical protein